MRRHLRSCPRAGLTLATFTPAGLALAVLVNLPAIGEDGWIHLFDGVSLEGWRTSGGGSWAVEDGALVAAPDPPSPGGEHVGWLYTEASYRDFELTLEFQAPAETNSGVFVRSKPHPENLDTDAYEINIAPAEHPFPTGSLVGRLRAEGIAQGTDWRALRLLVQGDRIKTWIDGEHAFAYTDPEPLPEGHVALQVNQGPVRFRRLELRPLGD